MTCETESTEQPAPRWRPLDAVERRVLGVLIEKAKTTPENYPLSLNSIRTGCNQKSNRSPLMHLEEDAVEESLESLRQLGAVSQIQGGARVDKYRHLAYEWLGVEKVELAVMAELLLRGAQTVGELRGRAARMEPIKDLAELQPTLDSLKAKRLIVYLTPPGRGSVLTHALYLDREMEKVRREAAAGESAGDHAASAGGQTGTSRQGVWSRADQSPQRSVPASPPVISRSTPTTTEHDSSHSSSALNLAGEIHRLQQELADVKREFLAARAEFEAAAQDLRREFDALNRQLGN